MVFKKKNILGNVYGLWKVIGETDYKRDSSYSWICKCKCGTEKLVEIGSLQNGTSKSCGCHLLDELNRKEKISKNYKINEHGCWIWQGFINQEGYGRIGDLLVHRLSYKIYKGDIPSGMCVCHNCPGGDNRSCINPNHLWLGTSTENIKDKKPKGRQLKGQQLGTSKLKDFHIPLIRKKIQEGKTLQSIAKEFNVSNGLISHIKQGRIWKHLL